MTGSLERVSVAAALFAKNAGTLRPTEPEAFIATFRETAAVDFEGRKAALAAITEADAHALDTHPSNAARAAALPELAGSETGAQVTQLEPFDDDERRLSAFVVAAFQLPLAGDDADSSGDVSSTSNGEASDSSIES